MCNDVLIASGYAWLLQHGNSLSNEGCPRDLRGIRAFEGNYADDDGESEGSMRVPSSGSYFCGCLSEIPM